MREKNKRRHSRLRHSAKIRVIPPPGEVIIVDMFDFSESGLYLICDDTDFVQIGDIVKVNTMEFEGAPVQRAKVIRIETGKGFAVEFIGV